MTSLAGTVKATEDAPFRVLKGRAFFLGAANAFDYALQYLLPVVLVRYLDPAAFGEYRLLWLVVMTVMAIAPLAMPQSLYYFLPRSDAATKRLYVHQTLLYLASAGLIGAWAVSPWNPLLPDSVHSLSKYNFLVPALVVLWAAASLLDVLPTIEERVNWQVRVTISLSLLRTLLLALAAYLTSDLSVLIGLLVALACFKLSLLLFYISRVHGLMGPWFERQAIAVQMRHATPFGVAGALYALRGQADQWVAASFFSLQSFAAFSVAAVLGPMINLFRMSVNHAFLPSMSRLQAQGDIAGMLTLNSRANVMVGALVYPLLAFVFVYTEEIVTLIYTANYIEAAPVMRLYIVSLVALVVELYSITLLLKEGNFALRLNLLILFLSVAVSLLAALRFGLIGAAAGSAVAIFLDRFNTLKRIAARTGIKMSQLQDWHALGRLMAFAIVAATLTWSLTSHYHVVANPILRVLIGGLILMACYAVLAIPYGLRRGGGMAAALNTKGSQ